MPTRRRSSLPTRLWFALAGWRLRGWIVFVAYRSTFGWERIWARNVIPGELLVSTRLPEAARALELFLNRRRTRIPRKHRIRSYASMLGSDYDASPRRSAGPALAASYHVLVPPGSEQAVLREIEYGVAWEMARKGGYTAIGTSALLRVGRVAIAANQVRCGRLQLRLEPPGPVSWDSMLHHDYTTLLGLRPEAAQRREVKVAILDTAVRKSDLPGPLKLDNAYGPEQERRYPPFAHGAVTSAIIGDLAPCADITIIPIADERGRISEDYVFHSLLRLRPQGDLAAEVVVMCLGMSNTTKIKTKHSTLEMLLSDLGADAIIVTATGNTRNADLRALEPARQRAVYAFGAMNKSGARSRFSRSAFDISESPTIYMLAPGGDRDARTVTESSIAVNGKWQVGSSIATAYGAGVIVRTLTETPHALTRRAVTAALLAHAAPLDATADAGPGCHGRLQQPSADWDWSDVGANEVSSTATRGTFCGGAPSVAAPRGGFLRQYDLDDPAVRSAPT